VLCGTVKRQALLLLTKEHLLVEIDLMRGWNHPWLICYNRGKKSPVSQAQPSIL
jgi:hypothetical protein